MGVSLGGKGIGVVVENRGVEVFWLGGRRAFWYGKGKGRNG